ncbi:MAG: hypothetical protein ACKV2T_05890 [Kofleriaceae bacterium]
MAGSPLSARDDMVPLLGQLATTLPLVGLIWFVQVVAYPLFARVGSANFSAYHQTHSRLITYLVAPLMAGELAFAMLWILEPAAGVPRTVVWAGAALAASAWIATVLVSVPQHAKLTRGFDARAHQVLTVTNWLRTAIWTARGAILIWVVAHNSVEAGV